MLPSTSSSLFPQDILIANLHYNRRLLLHTPFYHLNPTPPAPTPSYQLDSSSHGSFNANLIMVIALLLCALICSLCVNSLIRCMIKCSTLINQEPSYNINIITHDVTRSGLDKKALSTFPVVKYSNEVKIQGLATECVICLSEVREGERLRILPKCNHGFHVKCIDKWLSSHSSCPTCRHSLVDTCQKIIECDNNHQASSSTTIAVTGELIAISIVPSEREDLIRNYKGQIVVS